MENEKTASTRSSILSLLAIILIVIGILFFMGGITFPLGDILAIGLGLELQIAGFGIIIFQKK